MKRLYCLLTGGHRYEDKNITSYQHPNSDYVTLENHCVKCGKETKFDFFVGGYVRAELKKRKGGAE